MAYKRGWQGSGNLAIGSTTQDVLFQADFQENTKYYTVQFNVGLPVDLDPNQLVLPRAELIWSVEGGSFVRRVINIGNGTAISGTGQAVRVRMFDYSLLTGPAREYFVSAQVTPGTRPNGGGSRPPILTTRTIGTNEDSRGQQSSFGILPGGNFLVGVPQNAGVTTVLVNARTFNPADAPITQNHLQITHQCGTANLDGYNYDACGLWLPIAPATTDIYFENGSPTASILITPTWGIEG